MSTGFNKQDLKASDAFLKKMQATLSPSPAKAKSKSVPHPRHRFNPARGIDRKTFPKKCPKCKAKQSNLSKNGFDKDGRRMYKCKACKGSFYESKVKQASLE